MSSRRKFIREAGFAGLFGMALPGSFIQWQEETNRRFENLPDKESEDFWNFIRNEYTVSRSVINLNNGGVSPQPRVVQQAEERFKTLSNEAPSYYMWRILDQGREPLRENLANLAGCNSEELAICRNTSEALETVIFGLELNKGDEVVLCKQDYPNMINAWKQREMRDGIVLKWVNLDLPQEDENLITDAYTELFSSKTKLVHITHMINWTGQILPVKNIASKAKEKDIEVLVDGAHTFAHLDFKIDDLNCDYFGTSLHKWLCAPFGTGMLYVKKDKISGLWPLFAGDEPKSDNIRKFENLGTRSFPAEMAIAEALNFHNIMGSERKQKRLHYLKNYWLQQVLEFDRVKSNTSLNGNFSCAIANISIEGLSTQEFDRRLFRDHKIHTVGIEWENINGVRITPNVYTSLDDLDRLVEAIAEIASV